MCAAVSQGPLDTQTQHSEAWPLRATGRPTRQLSRRLLKGSYMWMCEADMLGPQNLTGRFGCWPSCPQASSDPPTWTLSLLSRLVAFSLLLCVLVLGGSSGPCLLAPALPSPSSHQGTRRCFSSTDFGVKTGQVWESEG